MGGGGGGGGQHEHLPSLVCPLWGKGIRSWRCAVVFPFTCAVFWSTSGHFWWEGCVCRGAIHQGNNHAKSELPSFFLPK